MKVKSIFTVISIVLLSSLISCDDKDEITQEQKDNQFVNKWMHDVMSINYYWNTHMPAWDNTDKMSYPEDFFKSLLFNYQKPGGDRFSWAQNNYQELMNSLSGVSRDIGFEYLSTYINEAKTQIGFFVLYPKKNTDATQKGIKRGDVIIAVNGNDITKTNYASVLTGANSYKLKVVKNNTDIVEEITVNVMEGYKEDPIYYYNTYEKNGKKIGYIVYNFFAPDNGEQNNKYDLALINKIGEFKAAGVSDFILDLRYNGGGYIISSAYLASALVPNRKIDNVFCYSEYNPALQSQIIAENGENSLKLFFPDNVNYTKIPQLGLNKIYVIATEFSASASELVINGLRPYMEVVHVGTTTVGKNMGSSTFYVKNEPRNKWGIQPLTMKLYNSIGKSDYSTGFIPNQEVDEFDFEPKDLGDVNEILLSRTIDLITGNKMSSIKRKDGSKRLNIIKGGSSLENKPNSFRMYKNDFILK